MSLLKKSLQYLYNTPPALFLRSELRNKVNSILLESDMATDLQESIHQKNQEVLKQLTHHTSLQQHQIDLENNQLEFLRVASNKQNSIHEKLNFHNDALAQIKTEAIIKHDAQIKHLENITAKQGFSALFKYRDEYADQFATIIERILGTAYPNITNYIDNFYTEVFIDHMLPGGTWKLKNDIYSFIYKPLPEPIPHSQTHPDRKQKALKLLIISGTFPSILHGGGGRLLDIIVELSKNHQIDLFSHYIENLDAETLAFLGEKIDNIKIVDDYDDFTVEKVTTWLRSINRENGYYDVVQLEYPQTIRFINPLKRYGKKVGYTFMESLSLSHTEKLEDTIKNLDYDNITKYSRSCWQAIADEKYALSNADFCIAVTDKDADFLNRLDEKKLHIIPTCVSTFSIIDELEIYKDIVPENDSVCFLGFFGHWPNIEAMQWYLNDIHPLVKKAIPGYKFYIVGSGNISSIKEICEGDKNVVVTGKVDSIVPHLLKAKVCISPLISGAGIRGKQNQYSLIGRPSVTTSIGNKGLDYVHEESVMVADSPGNFAKAIIRLLTDERLYQKLQKNSQEIAFENYTWKKHLDALLSIFQE